MTETVGIALIGLGIVLLFAIGMRLPTKRDSPLKIAKPPPLPLPVARTEPNWAEALDQFERDGAIRAVKNEKRRGWLRPIGFVARLVTYAAIFIALYIFAPEDISNRPFASLTINDIFRTGLFVAIGLFLIRALFEPSDSDDVRGAWGWLGVWMGVAIVLIAMIFGSLH